MAWTIADVARMSGVTSRTLRHYDEIGLLTPARVGSNGYRYYEEEELLRLQQILVLRELRLGLSEIADVLAKHTDEVEALRAHHRRLVDERDRLATLVTTVARTIAELENRKDGSDMTNLDEPENLFEGFDTTRYDADARQKWPQEWEDSKRFSDSLAPEDHERMQRETSAQMFRMAELMEADTPVDDPAVQAEIDVHYRGICKFWTPTAAAYKHLGETLASDAQWKATYDRVRPGLADYHRDAMAAYADAQLD
ncbi:MerR family transcriptional regulator [Rhodococcus rhodnii]|uniref:Transcriptional regulator n=2 Tax=Rhodococcus rhodnii TaxID=38312 RepID=R7WJ22_9NOCA|nr:MerR family transcriptional regulator [Rhodococcus rhodnii]EOM75250.1 transcriptional regulator [Rhodococcus rhodnii LMG 5362]TXG92111.1 MerR family transcriptional regulator [Rhodococcus rhodnii]